jgi:TetR/AcrR family transcriptional repressor of nem operon
VLRSRDFIAVPEICYVLYSTFKTMKKHSIDPGNARMRMIQAAQALFHQQGIHATSVDQVLKQSGTGKSQFAHYFKTKDGLVHEVLRHLHECLRGDDAPVNYRVRTWDDLETWFRFFVTAQRLRGCDRACPVGTIGNDLADEQELLRQDVRLIFEWVQGQLGRFFAERRATGELPASVDPDELADFCIVTVQGGLLVGKIKRDSTTFDNAVKHALAYLQVLKQAEAQGSSRSDSKKRPAARRTTR